jgi:hypothetical protein
MKFLNSNTVQTIVDNSPSGKNTKFLSAAHSLWYRFKNYDKCPPMAYEHNGEVVCMIFATFNRDGYSNLYEIVTLEGKEGNGFASRCWDEYIKYAVEERNSKRLKISCTPTSVTWHKRNGLIFWAVDPSGSLRSDQPLFSTRQDQVDYQTNAVNNPIDTVIQLPEKAKNQFLAEGIDDHGFGTKKKAAVESAISAVGQFWLRDALVASKQNTLEEFI